MGPKNNITEFNPFPGLRPFAPEDSSLFFGRGAESDEVILKLLKNRYITVIGAAGSGKSSLIHAGVLPKMLDLKIRESSSWRTISFRPGNDPFGNLAGAISAGINDQGPDKTDKGSVESFLLNNPGSFSDVVRRFLIRQDDNVLLIVDQFEDLFRYQSAGASKVSSETIIKFVDFLIKSVVKPDVNVFLIFSMRSEYLGDCSHYKGLTRLVNNSNYLVTSISADNLSTVIEGPVKFTGAEIEQGLVETILDDCRGCTDQLSVLQHAMMRTWARWQESHEALKPVGRSDYERAGTIREAISVHAEELYGKLNERGKEICELMFKAITSKGADNKGLRQPSDIKTIKSIVDCSLGDLYEVADKFRSDGNSFILPSGDIALSSDSVIDLQNECLIRSWDRLRIWIDEEASSIQTYLRLSEASALYQQGKATLCRPPDLQAAILWRDLQRPTLSWAVRYNPAFERAMVYLRTSEKAFIEEEQGRANLQKRKQKRIRLTMRILGVIVVAAMGLMFSEHIQKQRAVKQSVIAENQRMLLLKEKVIADSSVLTALHLKAVSDSNRAIAIKNAEEAKKQIIVSDVRRSFAERTAAEAIHKKKNAEELSKGIQRLRMLSVGKSMSLRSLQMNGQKELQTLLAFQAYLFNKRNNGSANDADIFAGLYNVGRQYGGINYRSYRAHKGEITSIAFIPGKNEFFTSGNDGQVIKWSLERKEQTLQVIYSGSDVIDVMAVSPDASWLACGSTNSSIRMIPLKGNNIGYELGGHHGGIKSLVFSYDGKYLYSAALDGKVLQWDIAARTNKNVATGSMEITSIDISSGGNFLAGIGADGNVLVWNPDHSTGNFKIETKGRNIKSVRFNPGNNLLAVGDGDGNVELWDIELQKKLSEVKAHDGQINDIQFNPALNQMATSGNDKKLKIFNIKDPADLTEPPVTFTDNDGFVLVMKFSPDGHMIVSGESGEQDNLVGRPTYADYLVNNICSIVSRNMTHEEWNSYVGKDIPFEKTCQDSNFNIKIEQVKATARRE
jgi:WD40 repeat protein